MLTYLFIWSITENVTKLLSLPQPPHTHAWPTQLTCAHHPVLGKCMALLMDTLYTVLTLQHHALLSSLCRPRSCYNILCWVTDTEILFMLLICWYPVSCILLTVPQCGNSPFPALAPKLYTAPAVCGDSLLTLPTCSTLLSPPCSCRHLPFSAHLRSFGLNC